jgi:SAM-dependent methyltransferase
MATVAEHYDGHLGPVYGWMLGDFEAAVEAAGEELRALGLAFGPGTRAVDLGCGPGPHAIALGRAGAEVHAIDGCAALLDELRERSRGLDVRAIHGDIARFRDGFEGRADLVSCMGDTLTHLDSEEAVSALLRGAAETLREGGAFVTTFRDYTGPAPVGPGRFIPVKADADRILTCCIEYGESTVTVTDLLHERRGASWEFRASSYTKLRIAPSFVEGLLRERGLIVRRERGARGMVAIVGRRM